MILHRKYQNFYQNYSGPVVEQAVVSEDLDQRLQGYLSNEKLLAKLADIFKKYPDGEHEIVDLDKTELGINQNDRLFVNVDKSEKRAPKFFMWIMNDQFLWGEIDMDIAASILKAAGEGTNWTERGIVGTVGSIFSTSGTDAGTDEENIAALAAAFAKIAAAKSVDPQIYFDKLDEIFSSKYGTSVKDFLETEFSGYAEVVSCNLYRRKIEPSVLRGLNMWSILGDIALTVVTFGGSAAFTAGLKGAQLSSAAARTTKLGKAIQSTKAGQKAAQASYGLGKAVKGVADITRLSGVFAKLDKARKISALEKAGITAGGAEFTWVTNVGRASSRSSKAKILSYTDNGAKMSILGSNGRWIESVTGWQNILTQLAPATAVEVITAAGINKTTKGLVAARAAGGAAAALTNETPQGAEEPGMLAKGAEAMGYYDTMAADPSQFIENAKKQGASDIAAMLLDLKNGSGIFGNTTDQEECAIALLITGLTPEMAKEVNAAYSKIDVKSNIYDVIDDELGGDISILAKAYWSGCTGEGKDFDAAITKITDRIMKKSS
jgi:hypothetical protein